VGKVIAATINDAKHPAYDDGAKQFGSDSNLPAGFKVLTSGGGRAPFADDETTKIWAVSVTLESQEFEVELDDGADYEGLQVTADVGDAVELIPGLVVGDGDYPG
jgi:hypothetical protein